MKKMFLLALLLFVECNATSDLTETPVMPVPNNTLSVKHRAPMIPLPPKMVSIKRWAMERGHRLRVWATEHRKLIAAAIAIAVFALGYKGRQFFNKEIQILAITKAFTDAQPVSVVQLDGQELILTVQELINIVWSFSKGGVSIDRLASQYNLSRVTMLAVLTHLEQRLLNFSESAILFPAT